MLVLKRRPGESLFLTLHEEFNLDPIKVTILDDGKIGVEAENIVQILRAELLDNLL